MWIRERRSVRGLGGSAVSASEIFSCVRFQVYSVSPGRLCAEAVSTADIITDTTSTAAAARWAVSRRALAGTRPALEGADTPFQPGHE